MTRIHDVFSYLRVRGAAAAIEFYGRAFGATEKFRLVEPGTGRVGHAELDFGGTTVMLSDEFPEHDIVGPEPGAPARNNVTLHLHVDDADAMIAQAIAAGATLVRPVADAFHGERGGVIRDPFGHDWLIGHSLEEVSPAEMQRRYDAMMEGA
jgi:uncharacterized glyoxalase superfamily protein PhnB